MWSLPKTAVFFGLLQLLISHPTMGQGGDPTRGFTPVPLSNSNFQVQKPYDVPQNQRYSFHNGVHKLWVFSNDKPFMPSSPTKPRTEIRLQGNDYSSGVWQFEGEAYVPRGTSGVSIMQVFGGSASATTLMLRVYEGELRYYNTRVVAHDVYHRWFRVNVIHDVGAGKVQVYVDGVLRLEAADRGGNSHYFKFGVYAQDEASTYLESRWRGIKIFRKA